MTDFIMSFLESSFSKYGFKYRFFTCKDGSFIARGINTTTNKKHNFRATLSLDNMLYFNNILEDRFY